MPDIFNVEKCEGALVYNQDALSIKINMRAQMFLMKISWKGSLKGVKGPTFHLYLLFKY